MLTMHSAKYPLLVMWTKDVLALCKFLHLSFIEIVDMAERIYCGLIIKTFNSHSGLILAVTHLMALGFRNGIWPKHARKGSLHSIGTSEPLSKECIALKHVFSAIAAMSAVSWDVHMKVT